MDSRLDRAGPVPLTSLPSHGGRGCGPLTPKDDAMRNGVFIVVTWFLVASTAVAQRGPTRDPLVQENATVQLAAHTYVIPDGNVGAVPNVGIVVGTRATPGDSIPASGGVTAKRCYVKSPSSATILSCTSRRPTSIRSTRPGTWRFQPAHGT